MVLVCPLVPPKALLICNGLHVTWLFAGGARQPTGAAHGIVHVTLFAEGHPGFFFFVTPDVADVCSLLVHPCQKILGRLV